MPNENEVEVKEVSAPEVKEGEVSLETKDAGAEIQPDTTDGEKAPEKKPTEADEKERNRKFAKDRIDKRNRMTALEIENAKLKGELGAIEKYGLKKPETHVLPKVEEIAADFERQNPKPKASDFETVAEHAEAVASWAYRKEKTVDSKLAEAKDAHTRKTTEQGEQERANQDLNQRLNDQRDRGEEKYEDFYEVVSTVEFHPATLTAMAASESGEDIAYYLAGNPTERERIEKLKPILQAKEIGRIEAGIESGKIVLKKTTTAPPPPRTVSGNANPKPDTSKLSDADWFKQKQQQKINSA